MIVLATCNKFPDTSAGLKVVVQALSQQGQRVRHAPWQSKDQHLFNQARYVLPLGVWDYTYAPEAFKQWVVSFQDRESVLLNSPRLLLRNINKTYLLEMAEKGLSVVPTRYLKTPSLAAVRSIQDAENWGDVVVKPVCGQSGHLVTRLLSMAATDMIFKSDNSVLVQPFIPEIKKQGELSLCFIAGVFSHAVCRMPAENDWRANTQYDVSVYPVKLSEDIIRQAADFLTYLEGVPLYARVDGVILNECFTLSELELIEPALFFDRVKNQSETGLSRLVQLLSTKQTALYES